MRYFFPISLLLIMSACGGTYQSRSETYPVEQNHDYEVYDERGYAEPAYEEQVFVESHPTRTVIVHEETTYDHDWCEDPQHHHPARRYVREHRIKPNHPAQTNPHRVQKNKKRFSKGRRVAKSHPKPDRRRRVKNPKQRPRKKIHQPTRKTNKTTKPRRVNEDFVATAPDRRRSGKARNVRPPTRSNKNPSVRKEQPRKSERVIPGKRPVRKSKSKTNKKRRSPVKTASQPAKNRDLIRNRGRQNRVDPRYRNKTVPKRRGNRLEAKKERNLRRGRSSGEPIKKRASKPQTDPLGNHSDRRGDHGKKGGHKDHREKLKPNKTSGSKKKSKKKTLR